MLLLEGKAFSFPIEPGVPHDHKLPRSRCHLFSEDSASLLSSVQADLLCSNSDATNRQYSTPLQTDGDSGKGWLCEEVLVAYIIITRDRFLYHVRHTGIANIISRDDA